MAHLHIANVTNTYGTPAFEASLEHDGHDVRDHTEELVVLE